MQELTTLESILKNTAELFWKNGFESVTFAQVAKKVGVSQPALYSYVKNKMDLLAQVFLWSAGHGRLYIDSKIDPRNKALVNLNSYIEANLNFFYEQKVHAHSILALYYFGMSSSEIRPLYEATRKAAINRMSIFIIQAQHENQMPPDCEVDLAVEIHTALVGFTYRSIYANSKTEQSEIIAASRTGFKKIIDSYR